ncbi:MAG: hypothetical protein EZS28_047895, partial [Streblomastix strix]
GDDDALLLLKVGKTSLVDAQSKTEADAIFDDKLNISDQIYTYTKGDDDALLQLKSDKTELIDAYSKTEADALFDEKLNITDQIDVQSKTEADALIFLKADKTELIDAYTKGEADSLLDDKLNMTDQIDAYTKGEDDALLLLKADKTELADYVDLTSAQTITGQKQFNSNVSAAAFAKTGKNEASILLAGGGDMLVSSLVSQPQLQEVQDIASGKSKRYVFETTEEMNTWMEDQENVAKLAIEDNLSIKDKYIMDYWWHSTSLRALETELPDMSNVMTILGTATGGDNAITDLSFDGNTIIPAKNSSFITTNYCETITVQKMFNTNIHSVGIMVQTYDYNSVVCADGAYSQIEADALFVDKLNVCEQIVAYTNGEDDALLLLKA